MWTDSHPPPGWQVPDNWRFVNLGRCRSCRAPIQWCRHHVSARSAPFDPDGTSHFATCPDAPKWRHDR